MKKLRIIILAMLGVFAIAMTVTTNAVQAHASSSTTTPKALRGTWYRYRSKGHYDYVRITPHSFTFNGTKYTPYKSGAHKLKVSKWGSWYSFNKGSSGANLGQFKTEKRLIKDSYKKSLVRYHGLGTYNVYAHGKYGKDYSFKILD